MKHRLYIRALPEEVHIHGGLTSWFNRSLDGFSGEIDENHIVAGHISFVMLGWSDQNHIILQLPGKIATMAGDILFGSQVATDTNKGIYLIGMFFQQAHKEMDTFGLYPLLVALDHFSSSRIGSHHMSGERHNILMNRIDHPRSVSYTHLTLPTNREV